jgi:hypothetical protein
VNRRQLLTRLVDGSLNNVSFTDMVNLVGAFGFKLRRTNGSHHIFAREGTPELINLQDVRGQAKPYQVRQFLRLVEKHNLALEEER